MGPFAAFAFFLAGLSLFPTNLVDLIDADDYFKSQQIVANAERMDALARMAPADGAGQITQLLAIRWLGKHGEEHSRQTLRRIAEGRIAQDSCGFAREYAQQALGQHAGNAKAQRAHRKHALLDALCWFPDDTSFCGALDLSGSWTNKPFAPKILEGLSGGGFPAGLIQDKEALHRFAAGVGNLRLTGIFLGITPPRGPEQMQRRFLRFTGLASHELLLDYYLESAKPRSVERKIGPAGERITCIISQEGPAAILAGNTDLMLIEDDDADTDLQPVLQQILDIRTGAKPSVLKGPLAKELQQVPDSARAFLLGDVPEDLAKEFTTQPPFPVRPRHIVFHATVDEKINIRFLGTFANAAESAGFVRSIGQLQKEHTAELNKLLPDPAAQTLIESLDSIRMESDGPAARGSAAISRDAAVALGDVLDRSLELAIGGVLSSAISSALSEMFHLLQMAVLISVTVLVGLFVFALLIIVFIARRRARGNRARA